FFSVRLGIGEEVVFLERSDVDFGKRCQLLAGELALRLRLDTLGGEHGEHVVEGPGVANAGHRSVGCVDELALDGHPDVRMRMRSCGRDHESRTCCESATDGTVHHRCAGKAPPGGWAARYHGLRRKGGADGPSQCKVT